MAVIEGEYIFQTIEIVKHNKAVKLA
jgi:hypothetical protein